MKRYFVVGTDTGVGKTTIAAALLSAGRLRGLRTAGMKPAESGCVAGDHGLMAEDAERLRRAAGLGNEVADVCLYRFEDPVAPGVAADQERMVIDFAAIGAAADRLSQDVDLLVVEGAGGLLVPLGGGRTLADLMVFLQFPAVVVGRAGLGTINHMLLTIEALRSRRIEIAASVLVATEPVDRKFADSNVQEIEHTAGLKLAGVAPYSTALEDDEMTRWVEQNLLGRLL